MKRQSDFNTKKEFFKYLTDNHDDLLSLKREQIKYADGVSVEKNSTTNKAQQEGDVLTKTIVGNTYLWLDSHGDVHAKGCFSKSIKERGDRIWHLHDHKQEITAKVGQPKEIKEANISWKELGVEKDGETEALMMTSEIKKELNPRIFNAYKTGEIDQHSVGMRYVRLKLAVNDEDEKQYKALWDEYYPLIGNPEEADKRGYFWVVKEAKLIEISCVLEGSNSLTPTLDEKRTPLSDSTSTEPSSDDTLLDFYNHLNI